MEVCYDSQAGTRRGATGCPETELALEPGEFITFLQGNWDGGAINNLRLESNKGMDPKYGSITINISKAKNGARMGLTVQQTLHFLGGLRVIWGYFISAAGREYNSLASADKKLNSTM